MVVLPIEHIISTPDKMGGSPRIAGTRIRVQDVADQFIQDIPIDEMAEDFGVTRAQIFAALSYYYDHRDEIEADIQRQIERADKFLAEGHATTTDDLRRRIEERKHQHKD